MKSRVDLLRGLRLGIFTILATVAVTGLVLNPFNSEDYIMAEKHEFAGFIGKHFRVNNAITIEYGVSRNGSGPQAFGGSKTWPRLTIEVPFEEGQEEKMAAVGKLFETLLRELKIIDEPIPKFDNIAKAGDHGLPHWVYGECYGCGAVKMFGGLCEKCDGHCPGCGVKRIRGRLCDECQEKGFTVCEKCGGLIGLGEMACVKCKVVLVSCVGCRKHESECEACRGAKV